MCSATTDPRFACRPRSRWAKSGRTRGGGRALAKLVADPFESVQAAAIFALGRIGDPSAAASLAKAEASTNPFLHMLATWALAKMNRNDDKRMADAIQRLVNGLGDKNREMAHMAAKALADLEVDPMKVRPLVDKMVAANPELADRVLNAFASLGPRAVPHAIEALKDPPRRVPALQVWQDWTRGGAGGSRADGCVEDGRRGNRTEALYALGAIGPAQGRGADDDGPAWQ